MRIFGIAHVHAFFTSTPFSALQKCTCVQVVFSFLSVFLVPVPVSFSCITVPFLISISYVILFFFFFHLHVFVCALMLLCLSQFVGGSELEDHMVIFTALRDIMLHLAYT